MHTTKGYSFRVIMIGDSFVGKTSILKSYCPETETNTFRHTGYIETVVKKNGQSIPLTIYDTGGMTYNDYR